MKIENVRYETDHNRWPRLQLTIDGQTMLLPPEQRRLNEGAVYLGGEFESADYRFIFPADPDDGRLSPLVLYGYSGDAKLLRIVRRFYDDLESGDFKVGDTYT